MPPADEIPSREHDLAGEVNAALAVACLKAFGLTRSARPQHTTKPGPALYPRAMDLSEYPLLNRPALMLLILKTAAERPVTMRQCRERLGAELARIHEKPDVPEPEIATELEDVGKHLLAARLLERGDGDVFGLTRRGRQVLAAHPMGVDETVLAGFPEYRAFIRDFARRRTIDDPRIPRYEEGFAAQQEGRSLSENPYPPDSVDHLAWENGWSEARDAEAERER